MSWWSSLWRWLWEGEVQADEERTLAILCELQSGLGGDGLLTKKRWVVGGRERPGPFHATAMLPCCQRTTPGWGKA